MAVMGLVPRWQCDCRLPLARRQKAGSISRRSMTSGMPNSAAKNFESENLRPNFLSSGLSGRMAAKPRLKRKSYFVDERALSRAKKALGAKPEAEAIRLSVERVVEIEEFWDFMKKLAGRSNPGAWRSPEVDCTHCTRPRSYCGYRQ